jgi:hypothetical protein
MVLAFGEGTTGHVEKPGEVRVRSPAEALGDIPRRRGGGIPDLIVEPKIPFDLGMIR